MHAYLRFPGFRKKALTLSYDDGMIFDRRLMEILDANGIKATFNLNSATYGHPRRFSREEAVALYKDAPHEIACHGAHHISLSEVDSATATRDILLDRQDHERTYDRIVRGHAYANGDYNDQAVEVLRQCGIVYARTVDDSLSFEIPTDWLRLRPTCHHANPRLLDLLDKFLEEPPQGGSWKRHCPRLFYVWGHSYEFNDQNNWEIIENFARLAGGHDSVWYATNIEIFEYIKDFEILVYSVDGTIVHNPTARTLWYFYNGEISSIAPGETKRV